MKLNLFALVLLTAIPAVAKEALAPLRTDAPPVIDGKLDDPVWQAAPHVTGFKTFTPDFGIDMADPTVVYFAYDRENLYFAFRCFDSAPDKIKSSISRRDNIRPDDWICINLASFTYIPGTVMHLGYGSLYEKDRFERGVLVSGSRFVETRRGVFAKASYLWRL
jgi:hypothetical protein